jgi:short-chain fatty acids transporter
VGALLAKEIAKKVHTVDYRLLIASAYSGFVIWHAGLSGSIPLTIGGGYTIGGVTYTAGTSETMFHPMNLIMVAVIVLIMPLVNYAMHPSKEEAVTISPDKLKDEEEKTYTIETPAEKLEHSKILWAITCLAGFVYIISYFVGVVKAGGSIANSLNLNIVNFIFMFLGLLLHGGLRRYVDAIGNAISGAAGILLQFPFYAGIMGIMVVANESGVSLAGVISNFFVSISNKVTFPMLTFLSAGIVNFFVPSGGGQWAVQGPIVMPAAEALGIEPGRAAMAIAWGDQWTNMIQPFWALPALGVAGLKAKDIMGFLVTVLLFTGAVACAGFLCWGLFF